MHEDVLSALRKEVESLVAIHASGDDWEQWNPKEIAESIRALHPSFEADVSPDVLLERKTSEDLQAYLAGLLVTFYQIKCSKEDPFVVAQAERVVTLRSIDTHWIDHIDDMTHLREQVAFSGYAQRDPLIEYKDQGFRRLQQLLATIESTIIRTLLQIDFKQFAPQAFLQQSQRELEHLQTNEAQIEAGLSQSGIPAQTSGNPAMMAPSKSAQPKSIQKGQKVGRNDACPCGSGKKYKKCHGSLE